MIEDPFRVAVKENYDSSLTVVEVIASGDPHKSRKRTSEPAHCSATVYTFMSCNSSPFMAINEVP